MRENETEKNHFVSDGGAGRETHTLTERDAEREREREREREWEVTNKAYLDFSAARNAFPLSRLSEGK